MYDAEMLWSIFVFTGSKRIYPSCCVSPYILMVGLFAPAAPETIRLPLNVVLPNKLLFPTWTVLPETKNEPV